MMACRNVAEYTPRPMVDPSSITFKDAVETKSELPDSLIVAIRGSDSVVELDVDVFHPGEGREERSGAAHGD